MVSRRASSRARCSLCYKKASTSSNCFKLLLNHRRTPRISFCKIRRAPSNDSVTSHRPKRVFFFFNFPISRQRRLAEKRQRQVQIWENFIAFEVLFMRWFPTFRSNKSSVHSHPAEFHFSLKVFWRSSSSVSRFQKCAGFRRRVFCVPFVPVLFSTDLKMFTLWNSVVSCVATPVMCTCNVLPPILWKWCWCCLWVISNALFQSKSLPIYWVFLKECGAVVHATND